MKAIAKLGRCPHCGEEAHLNFDSPRKDFFYSFAECSGCGSRTKTVEVHGIVTDELKAESKANAVELWNTRFLPSYKLQPCPKCGGEVSLRMEEQSLDFAKIYIGCNSCSFTSEPKHACDELGSHLLPLSRDTVQRVADRVIREWNERK